MQNKQGPSVGGWKGWRCRLCWVGEATAPSLKRVMAELSFQGGVHLDG